MYFPNVEHSICFLYINIIYTFYFWSSVIWHVTGHVKCSARDHSLGQNKCFTQILGLFLVIVTGTKWNCLHDHDLSFTDSIILSNRNFYYQNFGFINSSFFLAEFEKRIKYWLWAYMDVDQKHFVKIAFHWFFLLRNEVMRRHQSHRFFYLLSGWFSLHLHLRNYRRVLGFYNWMEYNSGTSIGSCISSPSFQWIIWCSFWWCYQVRAQWFYWIYNIKQSSRQKILLILKNTVNGPFSCGNLT